MNIQLFTMKIIFVFTLFLYINIVSAQDKLVLFFDFNQDLLNEKAQEDFSKWLLIAKNKEIVRIEGFCDSIDSREFNRELSLRRATHVLTLLKNSNVSISEKLELLGLGEDFQQLKNQSENRKVVVHYQAKNNLFPENDFSVVPSPSENKIIQNNINKEISLLEKFNQAKVGDLIKLENLNFYFNSEKIMKESEPILSNLLRVMRMNPQLRIDIYGHICCNMDQNDVKLSYRRSKAIFDFLIRNGIETVRLGYRGFGSSRPIYRLPEKNEKERAANRRVEILILQK